MLKKSSELNFHAAVDRSRWCCFLSQKKFEISARLPSLVSHTAATLNERWKDNLCVDECNYSEEENGPGKDVASPSVAWKQPTINWKCEAHVVWTKTNLLQRMLLCQLLPPTPSLFGYSGALGTQRFPTSSVYRSRKGTQDALVGIWRVVPRHSLSAPELENAWNYRPVLAV